MTRQQRPVSSGRRLAVVAAVVMLVGCLLPWYTFAGDLPASPFRAFDGSGILVFAAALAIFALVTLPSMAGDGAVGADRWLAYVLILGVAVLGAGVWPVGFLDALDGLRPDRAPGLWIALAGVFILALAARRIALERPTR